MPDYDLAPASPDGPGPIVHADLHCRHCSYNLRGLSKAGVCPECGKAVALSLKGELLRYSPGDYLRALEAGLSILLTALWLYVLLLVGAILLKAFAAGTQTAELAILAEGLMLLASEAFLAGYWKFTTPDPSLIGREPPTSVRRIARLAACTQFGIKAAAVPFAIVAAVNPSGPGQPMTGMEIAAKALGWLQAAAWAVLILAALRYTRSLSSRIPDEELAVRAKHFMWFLPLIFLGGYPFFMIGPVAAIILYASMLQTLHQRLHDTLEWQHRGGRHVFPG